jgi:alpha-L-fucosidase
MMSKRWLTWLAASFLSSSVCAQQPADTRRTDVANEPTQSGSASSRDAAAIREAQSGWYVQALKNRDARLQWWREARFGAFIHWGPYSVLGGEWHGHTNPGYAEHIMRVEQIPFATYRDEVAAKFHPDQFDAKEWVGLIKAAGMRYVIVTAKHHDGFALWPSEASRFDIEDTSHFGRDPLRELADACRAAGLELGFYYSHAFDWQDPDAPGNDWDYHNPGGDKQLYGGTDWYNVHPQFLENTERYVHRKAIPQLLELIQRYHPDILWFDTSGKLPLFQQLEIVKAVRAADPNVVINGRAARNGTLNFGDYLNTADRPVEVRPTPGDWEAIPTTNESYGWNKLDPTHKPASFFIQLLAKSAAKGGNILLNLGPQGSGIIDPPDVAILKQLAAWMQINGESIYATERTPLDRQSWGDSTLKGQRLYLHVFDWPTDRALIVGGLASKVKAAYLLSDPNRKALPVARLDERDVRVTVPERAPDAADSVVVVDTDGPVRTVPGRLIDTAVGTNRLLAFDAQTRGAGFSYGDGKAARYYVDGLEAPKNALSWDVRSRNAGTEFTATVKYSTASPDTPVNTSFELTLGQQRLRGVIIPSNDPKTVQVAQLGRIRLPAKVPAALTLDISPDTSVKVHVFEVDLQAHASTPAR